MARVHRVKTSRKEHICGHGNHVIPKGEGYLHASPGYRRRTPLIRCFKHPFRPSELTTSMASQPLAAVEAFEDAIDAIDPDEDGALDELEAAVEELRTEVEQYRDDRQAALDAWENGNSQLEELVETAEAAVSEVEGIVVEAWDGDEDDDDDAERRREHVEEQIEEARSIAGSLEF